MTQGFAWLETPAVQALLRHYGDAGEELRFVGGCVRDSVLGLPVHDIDACSPCPPERAMTFLKEAGVKVIPTGIDHGTITAVIDGQSFEVTTLRKDIETDGRHAVVSYTLDYAEDAARRDFTMNALYCDGEGTLTDFHNGIADAKAGRVTFIGDASARIQEDALRILRFFRFSATHGRTALDDDALEACAKHAPMLQQLSGERVQHEMLKLLTAKAPSAALEALHMTGASKQLWQRDLSLHALGKLLTHESMLRKKPDAIVRLAALLPSQNNVQWLCERWKLSKRDARRLKDLVEHKEEGLANIKRSIFEEGNALTIDRMLMALAGNKASKRHVEDNLHTLLEWQAPPFPITGKILKEHGVAEGPKMGDILAVLREKWIASDYSADASELLDSLAST